MAYTRPGILLVARASGCSLFLDINTDRLLSVPLLLVYLVHKMTVELNPILSTWFVHALTEHFHHEPPNDSRNLFYAL